MGGGEGGGGCTARGHYLIRRVDDAVAAQHLAQVEAAVAHVVLRRRAELEGVVLVRKLHVNAGHLDSLGVGGAGPMVTYRLFICLQAPAKCDLGQ